MFRRLLDSEQSLAGTVTSSVPMSPPPSTGSHTSATDLFIIYMVIGFSVTFACILILTTIYHCCRRSFGQFDVLGPRATRPRRQSSNRDGQPGHEPKQLFVVKHPGGDAHLAFREDEELKPYKKKSQASLYSATLDDDSFTIPAWKHDTFEQQMSSHWCPAAMSGGTVQQADHTEDGGLHTHPPENDLAADALNEIVPLHSLHPATRPTVADTASQTSPR